MTCIVALKHGGKVYMGADSAGVGGLSLTRRRDPKIYRTGPHLFGFTSSFRMGQLLGHALTVPHRDPEVAVEKYMATTFINAVRQCLKDGGFAHKEHEVERGGVFLVALEGRIWRIDSDYQVGENLADYEACGSGEDLAMGALHATSKLLATKPRERIQLALEAAEAFNAGVRAPFIVEVTA